jgi:hypothetical protein
LVHERVSDDTISTTTVLKALCSQFRVTLEGNINCLKGGTFDVVVPSELVVNPFAQGYPSVTKTGRIQFDLARVDGAWVCRRRGTSEVIDLIMLTFNVDPVVSIAGIMNGWIGLPTKMSVLYCDSKKKCSESGGGGGVTQEHNKSMG